MSLLGELIGAFGGSKQKSPVRTADTLLSDDYLEIVLGLTEGPIKGLVPGEKPNRPVENFTIDKTPLQSASTGLSNFSDFNADFYNGEETDGPIKSKLGGTSSNLTVGVRLAQGVDVVRQTPPTMRGRINQLEFRILFNQLVKQNDEGTFETDALFTISYKLSTSSTWTNYKGETVSKVHGKTTNGYVKDFLIDVTLQSTADYDVRVTKVSPDDGTIDIVEMTWESLQMTTLGDKTYSDLAVAHLYGKASNQFQSIPEFAGIYEGLLIKMPTNYNPDTRTYDETTPWDGTFKVGYTNNNAWVLYDMLTNTRYGLAKYYQNISANRYEFYAGAKWCDEMVSDGKGGLQPRFTYNDLITDLRNGLETIQYIAGSFNSIVYDGGNGTIRLKLDKYQEPDQLFTPENISKAGFSYTFSDISTRINDVNVSFVNPDMEWGDDRRAATIATTAWREANGIIPEEFIAVGCIDVHEAMRRANYRIITANTEVTTAIFTTTRFGVLTDLYNIIYIADPDAGWSTGGRIRSVSDNLITLRDPIYFSAISLVTLKVQTYEGLVEIVVTPHSTGAVYSLMIVDGVLPVDLPDRTVFTAESLSTMGVAKPFRVVSIDIPDGNPDQYQLTAVEVNINKYIDGDANTVSTPVNYSFRKPGIPLQPYNAKAESGTKHLVTAIDGTLSPRIYLSWTRPSRSYTDHYEIDYQESESAIWKTEDCFADFFYINGVTTGKKYDIHITAVSTLGVRSQPVVIEDHIVLGKEEEPPSLTGLLMTNEGIVWDELLLTDVPDLRGYILRFNYGASTDWGTSIAFHDGFLTDAPYQPTYRISGPITVLAKAIDTSNKESITAASYYGDMGNINITNIIHTEQLDPTFPGTLTQCSVISGELLAGSIDKFYGQANESFYGTAIAPFYGESVNYDQMIYTTESIPLTTVSGSKVHVDLIADGSSVLIEYRTFTPLPFYGTGTDPFYGTGTDPFYTSSPQEWKIWRGAVALPSGSYQWRITINSNSVRAGISLLRILVDAPDRYEDLSDVTVAIGGTVIPYTLTDVNAIKTVQSQVNANGVGGVYTKVDKTNPLAPVIFVYNSSNVAVGGATTDITITAY